MGSESFPQAYGFPRHLGIAASGSRIVAKTVCLCEPGFGDSLPNPVLETVMRTLAGIHDYSSLWRYRELSPTPMQSSWIQGRDHCGISDV